MPAQATMQYLVLGAFVLVGALAGGFIGARGSCETGACPLTSNPWTGAIYGALVAGLFGFAVSGAQPGGTCPLTGTRSGSAGPGTAPAALEQIEGQEELDDRIRNGSGVNVVVFTADWCGICKSYLPELQDVAADLKDNAGFYEVDVDSAMPVAREFSVQAVPNTLIIKDGKVQQRMSGRVSKDKLRGAIRGLLPEEKQQEEKGQLT